MLESDSFFKKQKCCTSSPSIRHMIVSHSKHAGIDRLSSLQRLVEEDVLIWWITVWGPEAQEPQYWCGSLIPGLNVTLPCNLNPHHHPLKTYVLNINFQFQTHQQFLVGVCTSRYSLHWHTGSHSSLSYRLTSGGHSWNLSPKTREQQLKLVQTRTYMKIFMWSVFFYFFLI